MQQERIHSFAPVCGPRPRVLVLGSMPSVESLARGEYYGNPRNAFWRIQAALFDEPFAQDYGERLERLARHGIALWDSASSCVRRGSLDSAIRDAAPNDIPTLLAQHGTFRAVFCNGQAAHKLLMRFFDERALGVPVRVMPSTSPAAAALRFEQKLEQWRCIHEFL